MKSRTRVALALPATLAAAAALVAVRRSTLQRTFAREVRAAGFEATGVPGPTVTEADLATLPPSAQRFLRFARVLGRPRDTTFLAHLRGRFRPKRGGRWLPAEIRQFNSAPDVARIFHMTLRMWGVPVYGRDTYVRGRGRMLIRPLDLFTVEDAQGEEYDVGELVTWLNDAVLFAPSMLLAPRVRFTGVDDRSFDLRLTDRGTSVGARVFVDERGAPVDFETTDRFFGRERARWTTPIDGWREVNGRVLATGGRATWHLPDGDFTYAELCIEPGDVVFNVAPGLAR